MQRRKKLGINTVLRPLTRALDLTRVVPVQVLGTLSPERVGPSVVSVEQADLAARISASRTCLVHLVGLGGGGDHDNSRSKKRYWLETTSRFKRTSVSWMLPKEVPRKSILRRWFNARPAMALD